jgi:uncharacterized protein YodC (DUF2158 family)
MPKFKNGDIVQLKSGGPKTVDSVQEPNYAYPRGGVWAVWFAGAKRERAHFDEESVDFAKEDSNKK